jgi:hypothetical protein
LFELRQGPVAFRAWQFLLFIRKNFIKYVSHFKNS